MLKERKLIIVKPRSKIDTWCYTTSNSKSRNRVKRIVNKVHRREDKKIIKKEMSESEDE